MSVLFLQDFFSVARILVLIEDALVELCVASILVLIIDVLVELCVVSSLVLIANVLVFPSW